MRIGISGAGYAARYFVKAFGELGYPVTGISNRTRERGLALADEAGVQYYGSLEEMVRNSGMDVLIVATATERHLSDIEIAVRAGIRNIFCEKPVGISIEETQKIRDICAACSVNLGVGYKMRFEDIFSKAKSLVVAGRIGQLVNITMNFYQTIPPSAWYLDSGYIRETMVHTMDLACWLADAQPESVMCHAENLAGGGNEDRASLLLSYKSGVTASLNGGWIQDYPYIAGRKNICFEIVGTGGYICGVRPGHLLLCEATGIQKLDFEQTDPIRGEMADFADRVRYGQPMTVSIDDAIRVQAILKAAETSKITGRWEAVELRRQ